MTHSNVLWPEGGLETVLHCPVCDSERRNLLHADLTDRVFYCAPGTWKLYTCLNCSCAYLDPRPTLETIHLAYQRYYTHALKRTNGHGSLNGLRQIYVALTNGYRNWRFGTSFRPTSTLGIIAIWLMPYKRNFYEREFRHLPLPIPGARLLDVGCGDGRFLKLAQAAGWEVFGCDPDPVTATAAKENGIEIRQGGVEAFSDMLGSFDVITMSHVIEHLHDPKGVSKEVYRLLKPGGIFWIETPNIQSYGHDDFAQHWRGLEPPRHLILFNWNALEWMLKNVGFHLGKRLPQYDVYPRLAAKSLSIVRGLNPYENSRLTRLERLRGFPYIMRTRLHPEKSEFITLIAHKPISGNW